MKEASVLIRKLIDPLVYLFVFIFFLNLPTDPDLGWHLKYGEYFFKTGHILRDNIFSTMMADYKWVNHSWAQDLIAYQVFDKFGFFGITILGSLVVTFTFLFLAKAFKLSFWDKVFLFPIVAFLVSNVNVVSFRTQLTSYLFTAILFYIISLYEKNPKRLYFTIPLFFLWANFHGGFILGLALLLGYIGIKKLLALWENRNLKLIISNSRIEVVSLMGIFVATLINPFGVGVYFEALGHFGSPWLKYIAEWSPFSNLSSQWWNLIIFVNLYLVGVMILIATGKLRERLPIALLILLFIFLSYFERRYAWSMYYVSFPILFGISDFFKPNSRQNQILAAFIFTLILLVYVINSKSPLNQYLNMDWNRYCQSSITLCSPRTLEFIRKNNLTVNLSTPYSWGGWMIWNYPDVKPSIDGRMHLWEDEKGYSAFAEYYTNVQDWESIDKSKYNNVLVLKQKPMFKRLKTLTAEGKWRFVYEDNVSAVFIRKTTPPTTN